MGKKKAVRNKKKIELSVINKEKTRSRSMPNNNVQALGKCAGRLRSAKTKPSSDLRSVPRRIRFAKPISATKTFSTEGKPSELKGNRNSGKSTPRSSKKDIQIQSQQKPILRGSVKQELDVTVEQKKVTVKQEAIEEVKTPPNSKLTRSGIVVNSDIVPPTKRRRRSNEAKDYLPVAIASIKAEPSSPIQNESVASIYRMVTRSGRQLQDAEQEFPEVVMRPIKKEPETSQDYEKYQITAEKSKFKETQATPSLRRSERHVKSAQTVPTSRVTRSKVNVIVKIEPVDEGECTQSAVTQTPGQDEVKIVREKKPKKRKTVQAVLVPKTFRNSRANDVFPMDDASKKYFPCPVPFCDQRWTERTTRNYHLRTNHPGYVYKDGDGWEKIKSRPNAMTVAAVAPEGASESRPSPDSSPPNSPSPPAVVPNSAVQENGSSGVTAAQRQKEGLAFANFLVHEQQRLRKMAPQLSQLEVEKMIIQKWTGLKPMQRLQYLIKKEPEILSSDQKRLLKRKLDEQLDSRIKEELAQVTPQLTTASSNPGPLRLRISKAAIEAARAAQIKKEPSVKKSKTAKRNSIVTASDFPEIDPFHPSVEQVESIVGRSHIQEERLQLEMMENTLRDNRQLSNFEVLSSQVSSYQHPRMSLNSGARDALHLYYLALCEPAFPRPGDLPLTEHRADHYWEQYLQLSRL